MAKLFLGQIVHTKSLNELELFCDGFVAVNADGKIAASGNNFPLWRSKNSKLFESLGGIEEIHLNKQQFLLPGLVDCHIHAPQVAQVGLGLDMPLMDWLQTYTFPLESKFADQKLAAEMYKQVVEATIRCGTTLASYFGTLHRESTVILAKEALKQGQRALVGKICANCNSVDYYVEETEESLSETLDFVKDIKNLNSSLIKPTITPRFAVGCCKELLAELGNVAREQDLHVQSHISENLSEIEFVHEIFNASYAEIYDQAGLLTPKTIMAHAVHLEDSEVALLQQRGTAVAHCPASNTCLSSGLCDIVRLLKNGIKVGLGTDVSGGNSFSMQNTILRTLDVSHHLEFIKKQNIKGTGCLQASEADQTYEPLNYKQVLFLATLGGAQALALDEVTGNFEVGKEFDALLVDTSLFPIINCPVRKENGYSKKEKCAEAQLLELVQKFVYVGDDRNIVKVFVAGKQIKHTK